MKKFLKNRKGFTLVEIVVVLVIIAILAAAAIPAMLGFIDDAKGKALAADARSIYIAAQTCTADLYAKNVTLDATEQANFEDYDLDNAGYLVLNKINDLTGLDLDGEDDDLDLVTIAIDEDFKVTSVIYTDGTRSCTLTAGDGAVIVKGDLVNVAP